MLLFWNSLLAPWLAMRFSCARERGEHRRAPRLGTLVWNLDYSVTLGLWASAGVRETFLEQMTGLEGAMKATQEQLRVLSTSAQCARDRTQKTCIQLAELGATLASSEEEIRHAASALTSLVPSPSPLSLGMGPGPVQPLPW
jgi:hypothetical protein